MNTKIKSLLALALCAVGLSAFAAEPGAVQLWEGGPYFATCNIGAEKPEDYGILTNFNDAAQAVTGALGADWRVPSKEEFDKLTNTTYCTLTWDGTKKGYTFTGKGDYSSNSIFLPAAGYSWGSGCVPAGSKGYYWSSREVDASRAWYLLFAQGSASVEEKMSRSFVLSVRAVRDTPLVTGPSVKVDSVTAGEPWSTITVNYTLGGVDAATDYKVAFDITAGGQTASVTNDATKLTDGAATKEINTVEIFGKEVVDTKAKVKVSLIAVKASSETEYVVMKMGTGEGAYTLKWATMNLGAEKVTDCGDYFAWGETAPYYEGTGGWPTTPTWKSGKESGYAWQSYCSKSSFSEWSTPPYDATTKILKPEFDAAAQILGDGWRMPTSAEFKALYDACGGSYDTKTNPGKDTSVGKGVYWCTNYDGVAGCLFCDGTNKLFFPAAGVGVGTSLNDVGSSGSYWSSSLYSGYKGNADFLFFTNLNVWPQNDGYRYLGFSVRPVKEVK